MVKGLTLAKCSTTSGWSQVAHYLAACPLALASLYCAMEKRAEELRNKAVSQRSNSATKSLRVLPSVAALLTALEQK